MTDTVKSRLIIIPDVHGRDFWREAVRANPDGRFIFLGDYLDPYEDECITTAEAFRGLQDIVSFKEANPERVTLLWGNHDLHYLYPEMMGSRYDLAHAERNARFFHSHQTLFGMAYETMAAGMRILFSHAGVGRGWLLGNWPSIDMKELSAELFNDLTGYPGFMSALRDVSALRWGDKPWGSMVWADADEQIPEENRIPGIVQVFGHTRMDAPVNYGDAAFCLDCRRCFYLDGEHAIIRYLSNDEQVRSNGHC